MELRYIGEPDMKTQKIRVSLYFLQLIENKIIEQYSQDLEEKDGFLRYMTLRQR